MKSPWIESNLPGWELGTVRVSYEAVSGLCLPKLNFRQLITNKKTAHKNSRRQKQDVIMSIFHNKQINKLRGLSPRANYTDLASGQIERCRVVGATDPYGRNISLLGRIRYVSSSRSSVVLTRPSGPRSRPHYFSQNLE
jgi:hypothetical protein